MNEHDVRLQIHRILELHAEALAAIRDAQVAMQQAFDARDAALATNTAALKILNRMLNERTEE